MTNFIVDSWESPVMLDAPVSGGILAADAGTLTFMVYVHFIYLLFSFNRNHNFHWKKIEEYPRAYKKPSLPLKVMRSTSK